MRSQKTNSAKPVTALSAGYNAAGWIFSLLLLLSVGCLSVSHAHQQKFAVTHILFNTNSGNIEVMHRFSVHDAEHAANLIFGNRRALLQPGQRKTDQPGSDFPGSDLIGSDPVGSGQQLSGLIGSEESRELFSSYVMNRFAVEVDFADGSSRLLNLEYVGAEIDGQFLWVYQETPLLDDVVAMTIVNLVLRDVWPDQSNLVNVERAGQINSVTFEGNDEALRIEPGA